MVLIRPQNQASHVQQFCRVLGLDPDQYFTLLPREPGEPGDPGCGHPFSPPSWGLRPAQPCPDPSQAPRFLLQVSPAPRSCPSPAP